MLVNRKLKLLYKKILFPKYIRIQRMFIENKYSNSTLYTLTLDTSFALAGQNHIGSYIVKVVCLHNPENKNN